MRLSAPARRFAVYALVLAEFAWATGCGNHNTTWHGPSAAGGLVSGILAEINLGEVIYGVVHSRLAARAGTGAAQAAALEARKADFVGAIDVIVETPALSNIGEMLQTVLDLVDDGTLPRSAENVAAICDALVNEPGQPTLAALVALGSTKSIVQTDDALAFVARLVNYPQISDLFTAIADMIAQNGQGGLVPAVEGALSRALASAAAPPPATAQPGLLSGIGAEFTVEAPPRGGASFGAPAWAVRIDANGNAAVATDPATGALYVPFVDANKDGVADVNAAGDPVDVSGTAIAIPAFMPPGTSGYDADGRALAYDGNPIYVYVDAKVTLLSHFLMLLGEGLRRGIHTQAFNSLALALGPRQTRQGPGGASYQGFDPANPMLDLVWGGLEILKAPELPGLFRALAAMQTIDPSFSELVLVTYGRIVEELRSLPAGSPPTLASRVRTDKLIVMLDQVFNTTGTPPSTGRLLLDVLHDLGKTARALPGQLALMIDYKTLTVDSQGQPIPGLSQPVDFGAPATLPGSPAGENRSILQQLLDLFTAADGCPTYIFAGGPLSESLLSLMAAVGTGWLQALIGFIDSPLVQLFVQIDCPAIQSSLDSVKGLAASGALAGFVPIAKAFVDHGQSRLFVDLLKTLDASWGSVREIEPNLSAILKSGAFDPIFDLDDALVAGRNGQAIVDPVSGTRGVDLVADLLGRLFAHPAVSVPSRSGVGEPTLLHLVIEPLRKIEDAAIASGSSATFGALYAAATDLFVERVSNTQLKNPSLTPFLAHVLGLLARNLPADDAQRAAALGSTQQSAVSYLDSQDFAALMDLGGALGAAKGGSAICDALAHLLTPDPAAADDAFGSLAKIALEALETPIDGVPLRTIAGFAAGLLDPAAGRMVDLLSFFGKFLAKDRGAVAISLLRNALDPAPAGAGLGVRRPAAILVSVADDIRAAGGATSPPASTPAQKVQALADTVAGVAAFIRDQSSGLAYIFGVIKNLGH
jgi:hypothetical protein